MSHPSETDLLVFFAGDLEPAIAAPISVHLDDCAECREVADRLTEVPRELWAALIAAAVRPAASGLPSAITIPGHEDLQELGRGGCGVVYLATESATGRRVALKILRAGALASPAEHEWFRAEARAAARLNHPNIVTVHAVGEANELPYYAMEYLPAGSLADRLDGAPLPSRRAAAMVEAIAEAIEFAHGQGVIHRDLKPGNILLAGLPGGPEVPKVSDFGMAKHQKAGLVATPTQAVLGTPGYMAPEQAFGRSRDAAPAMDIYALGAVLYELLTGRPPFQGTSPYETLLQVRDDDPIPPRRLNPGIPKDLETICLKCLEKSSSHRYPAASSLAADLRAFLEGRAVTARPLSWPGHLARWARRNPAVAALAGVSFGLLAAGLLTATALWRRAEARGAEARVWAAEAERRQASAREALRLYAQTVSKLCSHPGLMTHEERDALIRAVGVHERLLGEITGDPNEEDKLAYTTLQLADGLHNLSEFDQAVRVGRLAVEMLRRLSEAHPDRDDIRSHYADGCSQLGGSLDATGDRDGAFRYREEAVRVGEELVASHPGRDHYRGCLAIFQFTFAREYLARGNPGAAEPLLARSLDANRRLVARYPEDPHRYRTFDISSRMYGDFLIKNGQGLDRYWELVQERMELCDKAKSQPNWPQIVPGLLTYDPVFKLDRAGRHAEGDRLMEHIGRTWGELVARPPHLPGIRIHQVDWLLLDGARRWSSDRSGARECFRRAIRLLEPSENDEPDHLAADLLRARLLALCPDPSIRDPARALALIRPLPKSAEIFRYVLGISLYQVGEYREARAELERFLDVVKPPTIDKSIVHTDKSDDYLARTYLALTLAKLGEKERAESELRNVERAIREEIAANPFVLFTLAEAQAILHPQR